MIISTSIIESDMNVLVCVCYCMPCTAKSMKVRECSKVCISKFDLPIDHHNLMENTTTHLAVEIHNLPPYEFD